MSTTETKTCAGLNCNKPADLPCVECQPGTLYCSELCLKADYKRHKKRCTGFEKANCFLIRVNAPNGGVNDNDHIEKFPLSQYGDWKDEMTELQRRLGWKEVSEGGKFYTYNEDINQWYFFVYHSDNTDLPQNEIVSRCTGKMVYGDAAIIRSSPVGFNDYQETFSRGELLKTLAFYRDNNPRFVFEQREMYRLVSRLFTFTYRNVDGTPEVIIGARED